MEDPPTVAYVDEWVNAKEMNQRYPDTFDYDESLAKSIEPGDLVKIGNARERFWTVIQYIEEDDGGGMPIVARVDNLLRVTRGYTFDDLVAFDYCHIYGVQKMAAPPPLCENAQTDSLRP